MKNKKVAASLASLPLLLASTVAQAQTNVVDEIIVTGRRGGVPAYERPFGPTVIDAADLASAPQRRLDEALRAVPGFGLFRRNGSRIAQPTTQGVSLRGLGPNGAGRTLVLVDGVPVNDPFGGWVYWSRLPTEAAERVVITRGGGAGPWGNAALAGTVRIETRKPEGIFGEFAAGSDETVQAVAGIGGSAGGFDLGLTASAFSTGGQKVVGEEFRGPIDIDADSEAYWADALAATDIGNVRATAKLSAFREHRGNGTPYTENATDALEGSLRLVGGGSIPWEAVLYARDWDFESTFSGVNDDRTAETPALDQYDVPSTAYGGVLQVGLTPAPNHRTDIGVDVRWTEGETNELFFFQNDAFTRERTAGGEQLIAGAFAEHAWTPQEALAVTAGLRVDRWENSNGERSERVILTDAVLREDDIGDRDGTVLNGRIGADWQALPDLGLRVAAYTGFRLPTLNELYRPFRVGNDITEANPDLDPEELIGGEVGLRYTPTSGINLSATVFRAIIRDAVDNVELTRTPGLYAPLGIFVPENGSLAQRLNLDKVVVDGLEAELEVQALENLTFNLSYLFSDAEIEEADGFPGLEGNRPGQTPRHQGTAQASWRPVEPLLLRLQVRAATDAFEGSDNAQELESYAVADLYAGWDVTPQTHLFATVENLTDATIETGIRADGLINVAPGRTWIVGLRGRW
ncbi:TonB-dependent receptor plug domain-containing protein [Indioceanicola profundi]|uniref:TonB-dependent receptor plug domain-containing protein n=1 Tax=Indioceanicola profundi TaxID=2220096 RepID=UPI0013C42A51|nr:TonB-dependent receptor [Indioceanicola profundi]